MAIRDNDEIASIQATFRAFQKLVKKHKLQKEFQRLHKRYLPEELKKRRKWRAKVCKQQKVKVNTEDE